MTEILAATASVTTLVGDAFELITGNAYLVTFLAMGLLTAAIRVFKRMKSGAK